MQKNFSDEIIVLLVVGSVILVLLFYFVTFLAIAIIVIIAFVCILNWLSQTPKEEIQEYPKSDFKSLTQFENNKKIQNEQKIDNKEKIYKKYHSPIVPPKSDENSAFGIKIINSDDIKPNEIEFLPATSYATYSSLTGSNIYYCKNMKLKLNDDFGLLLENVALFSIFTEKDNNVDIYYENSKKIKPLTENNNYHLIAIHSLFDDKKQEMTVFTEIFGDEYFQICWSDYNDKNHRNLIIKRKGYKDVFINKIEDFYIYSINDREKVETIIYNGTIKKNLYKSFKDLYIVVFQGRKRSTDNFCEKLTYLKGNVILHRIGNINPCFSIQKKINKKGNLICQRFNDNTSYCHDISTIVLYENGNAQYISEESKKYETIWDFLRDKETIKKYALDINILDEDGFVNIYYFKKECLTFYILDEYTNNADYKEITKNIFEDDINTINFHVKYKTDRLADIVFCYQILSNSRSDSFFDNGLYGKNYKNDYIAGNAIYGIAGLDYFKGLEGDFSYINATSQFYLEQEQIDNFKDYVKVIYDNLGLETDYNTFPVSFTSRIISADIFMNNLEEYLRQFSLYFDFSSKNVYDASKNVLLNVQDIKDDIKKKLIKENKYSTKWKSELELYKLILKYYKNAIYQYHSSTLGHQSFDIFIPDLNIAFEYQGIQHYEPIDLFGGIEGLKKRQELDEKKRKICKSNNIILIEWKYTIPVNDINLKKIMADNNIVI